MLTAVKDFVYAALPWVVTGICIAIMAVRWKQVQVQQAIAEKKGSIRARHWQKALLLVWPWAPLPESSVSCPVPTALHSACSSVSQPVLPWTGRR